MRTILLIMVGLIAFTSIAVAVTTDVEHQVAASGSIATGLKGGVQGAPAPALVVIESVEAADNISAAIARAYPESKPAFRDALNAYKEMDFGKYEYVGIFTRPIDNYAVEIKSVTIDSDKKVMTIKFGYTWEKREYLVAPDLRIFFTILRLPKSGAALLADYGTETMPAALKPAGIETILPKQEAPKASFETVTQGKVALNEAVAEESEGPFLYALKSDDDVQKLDAKMSERFKSASNGIAKIVSADVKPDFGKKTYLVILSAPCFTADIKATDMEYNEEVGEGLLKVTYNRVPQAAGKNADIVYCVVAVPKGDSYFMLLVSAPQGERRVAESAIVLKPQDKAAIRDEYDYRLESINFTFADTLAQLGAWCAKNGLYEEARRHFAQALKYNPLNATAARGLREMDVMDSLNKSPSSPQEYCARAVTLMSIGRFADATRDVDRALKLDEKYAEAHCVRGGYLMLLHDYAGAAKSYDRAVELEPSKARYFAGRARCRALLGQFDESEKDSATALSLEKDFAPALDAKAINLLARASLAANAAEAAPMLAQARDLLTRAIEADPAAQYYADRALALLRLFRADGGKEVDLDGMFDDCVNSLQINPYQYEAYLHLATYYVYRQMNERAAANLDRAVEVFPDLAYLYGQRGTFYVNIGNNEAALKDFSKMVALAPNDGSAYIDRAKVEVMQKKQADALADFNKAVELSPQNPQYYWERGLFHYNSGDLESAVTDLGKTLEVGGQNASVYYMIGIIKMHMGQYAEAGTNFQKCLDLKPDEKLKADAAAKLDEAKRALEGGDKNP